MTSLKVMKALEYIHRNDLNNAEWNIEVDTCQSKPTYGTLFDINLPPHIAIVAGLKEVLPDELINNNPDFFLITRDGTQAVVVWTI